VVVDALPILDIFRPNNDDLYIWGFSNASGE
jgi:hypothetical protein